MPIRKLPGTLGGSPQENDSTFLIEPKVGGPNMLVERIITVDSVALPETPICQVERIRITEHVIPVTATGKPARARRDDRLH
jgi:hypothetical protein